MSDKSKLPPWSASSLTAYQSCPHRYFRIRVKRDVKDFPPSDAVLLGRKLHKAFENAVNLNERLPGEFSGWQSLAEQIKALPGEKFAEYPMAVDSNLKPTDYRSSDAFSRGIADLVVLSGDEAIILDYKTGKQKESNQLGLYAAYAFAKWSNLKRVHTAFVWLKTRTIARKSYSIDDVPMLWNEWLPIVHRLEHAYETGKWDPCPSGLCRGWCPVVDCKFCQP